MEGLEVELVLRLLSDYAQIGPQRGIGNSLGIIVVVLLSLCERLRIDRRDDPRLVTQLAQRPADNVGTEASLPCRRARGAV